MKIAITSTNITLLSEVDPCFEKAKYFLIIDPDILTNYELRPNPFQEESGTAAVACAQLLISKGVEILITGECCQEALQLLNAARISVYQGVKGNIFDTVKKFKNQQLLVNAS